PEAPHVELAGGGGAVRAVGDAVDHDPAGAADPLAAVVVERHRFLAGGEEPLVEDVEHLEERRVGADVGHLVGHQAAGRLGARLPPDAEGDLHLYDLVARCTFSNSRASRCIRGSAPSPVHSQAATWQKRSSSRFASPSSVWWSTRKCPPPDSSRWSASRHMRSASERKSATRPPLSADW